MRMRQLRAADAIEPFNKSYASRIRRCRCVLRAAVGEKHVRTRHVISCKLVGLCPGCTEAWRFRKVRHYVKAVTTTLTEAPHMKVLYVTLTTRAKDSIAAALVHLRRSLAAFYRDGRRLRRGERGRDTQAKLVAGGVDMFELQRQPSGTARRWTLHVHCLWLCDGATPTKARLAAEWRRLTGDSWVVDIEPLRVARLKG